MRHIRRVVVLIGVSAAFLAGQTDPPARVGRLNYMEGPVSFQPAGVNEWVDASVNRPLIPGDNIWVGDRGRAELHVGSTALRLGSNTAFEFLNLDDQAVQIRLSEGTLTVKIRSLAQDQVLEVDTPNLAFTLLRPGEYRIDANPDSETTVVAIRDGEGEITGGGQTLPAYARQRFVVTGGDQINYSLSALPGPDAWDQWCSSRDRREDQSQSARYVSREMGGYEDLDQYGRWDNQPGYGQVWMPTTVAAGWAPYQDGHWAWIAPWGWTWVDEAPWGFAPYHYGRWASFGDRWGWIPGPYGVTPVYAPALVAWIGGGSGFSLSFSIGAAPAVGWFPLGPREPYFPSYRVSQGYFTRVNNTNTVINNTTINNYYDYNRNSNNAAIANIQYANRNVRNGITAVPRDSFARGRRVTQDARAIPASQLASAQVFGAPTIAPQRESVLGSRADTASRARRPPANVLSRPVVARTAPPPAPVPFDRQQSALAQNPGRPLPTATVQQMRQGAPAPGARVRVVDMGRVRRVQPTVGAGIQGTAQQNPVPRPAVTERQNTPTVRQQPQPQVLQPPAVTPQPPVTERRNSNRERRQPQQQVAQPPAVTPQPPVFHLSPPRLSGGIRIENDNSLNNRSRSPQAVTPQPPAVTPQSPGSERRNSNRERQQPQQQVAQPPAVTPQPPAVTPQSPVTERRNSNRERQQPQQQVAQPPAVTPQPPMTERRNSNRERQQPQQQVAQPPAVTPQAPVSDRPQRQGKGNEQKRPREDDNKNKSDK